MDEQRSKGSTDGLGDDQGTRVGTPAQGGSAPRQHSDAPTGRPTRQTGAGSEASEGMHNAQQGGKRPEGDRTGLSGQDAGRNAGEGDERGSEPLPEDDQHRSGYGGSGGQPVNSSDTRERKHDR